MGNNSEILSALSELEGLCPAGYATALHINFATPKFLFQTYARDWMSQYSKLGLVMKDPTVRWGFENTGHVLWDVLKEQDVDGVLDMAASFGIKFGFTCATIAGGTRSICSFARDDRDFSEQEMAAIIKIAERLHDLTLDMNSFSSDAMERLKKMSIEFTHS